MIIVNRYVRIRRALRLPSIAPLRFAFALLAFAPLDVKRSTRRALLAFALLDVKRSTRRALLAFALLDVKRSTRRALLAFVPLDVQFCVGITALPLILALAGCGRSESTLPELTEVEGVVLLGGQPLPHAKITFNPTKSGLPANSIGIGVTDEAGKFNLTTAGKAGAIPGEHVLTIVEGPPPKDVRGDEGQAKLARYQASLKNRPIPAKYGDVNKSDTKVTVKTDQKEYKVELNR